MNNAVIDVSAILWNPEEFDHNLVKYYQIGGSLSSLMDRLVREDVIYLLRDELLQELFNGFPLNDLPSDFSDLGIAVYDFLSKIGDRIVTYESKAGKIKSVPDLVKKHYSESVRTEMSYLLRKIHSKEVYIAYFTHTLLHGCTDSLQTVGDRRSKEHDTVFFDEEETVERYFLQFKRIYRPSPKHKYDPKQEHTRKGVSIAHISCSDEEAQELLNTAICEKGKEDCYYNYDLKHEVYVVFPQELNNIFHGYDEQNIYQIPAVIRKHFNR